MASRPVKRAEESPAEHQAKNHQSVCGQHLSTVPTDFLNIFNWKKVIKLLFYRDINYKIKLTSDLKDLPKSRVYPLSLPKLRVYKEYLTKTLKKGYIILS